jgi:hypothetical protein
MSLFPETMDYHKDSQLTTPTHDDEAFFFLGMIRIWNHQRIFILEH